MHFGDPKLIYIPEKRKNSQITLFDFNQSCGMGLDPNNEWIKLAHAISWSRMETKYVAMFPSKTGHPATPRKQPGYVRRCLEYLGDYMGAGYALEERIVSISQPYLCPIVGGKAKSPVEFSAKYDVSIDEKGHARLEKLSFDAYNENIILVDAMNRYKERTGHYPKRVLADQIYGPRDNRNFCKDHNITMSGSKLGRPTKDKKNTREEYQDDTDRIEAERFFGIEKRCNGAGLIMTKLEETTLSSIVMSVLVTNLFAVDLTGIFLLYFSDNISSEKTEHYIIIDDVV